LEPPRPYLIFSCMAVLLMARWPIKSLYLSKSAVLAPAPGAPVPLNIPPSSFIQFQCPVLGPCKETMAPKSLSFGKIICDILPRSGDSRKLEEKGISNPNGRFCIPAVSETHPHQGSVNFA